MCAVRFGGAGPPKDFPRSQKKGPPQRNREPAGTFSWGGLLPLSAEVWGLESGDEEPESQEKTKKKHSQRGVVAMVECPGTSVI